MPPLKLVLIGPEESGKTCLVTRFISGEYRALYEPNVVDTYRKQECIDGENYLLDLVDIGGSDSLGDIRREQCADADGLLSCFAASDPEGIDKAREACLHVLNAADKTWIPCVAVACKFDEGPGDFSELSTIEVADEWFSAPVPPRRRRVQIVSASSRNNEGVTEAFHELVREVMRDVNGTSPDPGPDPASPLSPAGLRPIPLTAGDADSLPPTRDGSPSPLDNTATRDGATPPLEGSLRPLRTLRSVSHGEGGAPTPASQGDGGTGRGNSLLGRLPSSAASGTSLSLPDKPHKSVSPAPLLHPQKRRPQGTSFTRLTPVPSHSMDELTPVSQVTFDGPRAGRGDALTQPLLLPPESPQGRDCPMAPRPLGWARTLPPQDGGRRRGDVTLEIPPAEKTQSSCADRWCCSVM
eukprot:Hpha_TRINITY_DN16209_c1_g19::TRINITY_DN16209_c1_g19_i1::g.14006::m.14006